MVDPVRQAAAYLPLTEATFYILITLAKPCHGYGVIQSVRELSAGRLELGPGTLYGAFNRLLKQKLIVRIDETENGDERRKLYILTDLGRTLIRLEIDRLQEMVRHGENALALGGEK